MLSHVYAQECVARSRRDEAIHGTGPSQKDLPGGAGHGENMRLSRIAWNGAAMVAGDRLTETALRFSGPVGVTASVGARSLRTARSKDCG